MALAYTTYQSTSSAPLNSTTPSFFNLPEATQDFITKELTPDSDSPCLSACYASAKEPENGLYEINCNEIKETSTCYSCINNRCESDSTCKAGLADYATDQRHQVILDVWLNMRSRGERDKFTPVNCESEICTRSRVVGYDNANLDSSPNFGKFRARCAVSCGSEGEVDPNAANELRPLNCSNFDSDACLECLQATDDANDNICGKLEVTEYLQMIEWLKRNVPFENTCATTSTTSAPSTSYQASSYGSGSGSQASSYGSGSGSQAQTQNYGNGNAQPLVTRIHKRVRHVCLKKKSKLGLILGLGIGLPLGLLLLALCCALCLGIGICGLGGLGGGLLAKKKKSNTASGAAYTPIPAYAPVTTSTPYSAVQYSSVPSQSLAQVRSASPSPIRTTQAAPVRSAVPIRSASPQQRV